MNRFIKTISLFLCVLLVLAGLVSCEGSVVADVVLNAESSIVWLGSETVLEISIPDASKTEFGAAFSPELKASDVVLPTEMEGMTVSVAYVSDSKVKLTVSGTPGADISDSVMPKITFKNSAFQKNQITGYFFPKFGKPYLQMGTFSSSSTAEGKVIAFGMDVVGTEFDKLDYVIEGLADGEAEDPSKVKVEVVDGSLSVKLKFIHQADEEKPIVLVLKEGSFTLRKEIRVEIPKTSFGFSNFYF